MQTPPQLLNCPQFSHRPSHQGQQGQQGPRAAATHTHSMAGEQKFIIGVDGGTESLRAGVFDLKGNTASLGDTNTPLLSASPPAPSVGEENGPTGAQNSLSTCPSVPLTPNPWHPPPIPPPLPCRQAPGVLQLPLHHALPTPRLGRAEPSRLVGSTGHSSEGSGCRGQGASYQHRSHLPGHHQLHRGGTGRR